MDNTYFWNVSQELFALAEQAIDPQRTGHDLPGRRFIHHGQPVVEFCETGTMALWHQPIEFRQVGRREAQQTLTTTTFHIDLWRCWPMGGNAPPSVEQIEDAVEGLQVDGWCLLTGVQDGFKRITSCETVVFETLQALGPLGGMAGWRMSVLVGLSGKLIPLT